MLVASSLGMTSYWREEPERMVLTWMRTVSAARLGESRGRSKQRPYEAKGVTLLNRS
jgi:hypothetical protein